MCCETLGAIAAAHPAIVAEALLVQPPPHTLNIALLSPEEQDMHELFARVQTYTSLLNRRHWEGAEAERDPRVLAALLLRWLDQLRRPILPPAVLRAVAALMGMPGDDMADDALHGDSPVDVPPSPAAGEDVTHERRAAILSEYRAWVGRARVAARERLRVEVRAALVSQARRAAARGAGDSGGAGEEASETVVLPEAGGEGGAAGERGAGGEESEGEGAAQSPAAHRDAAAGASAQASADTGTADAGTEPATPAAARDLGTVYRDPNPLFAPLGLLSCDAHMTVEVVVEALRPLAVLADSELRMRACDRVAAALCHEPPSLVSSVSTLRKKKRLQSGVPERTYGAVLLAMLKEWRPPETKTHQMLKLRERREVLLPVDEIAAAYELGKKAVAARQREFRALADRRAALSLLPAFPQPQSGAAPAPSPPGGAAAGWVTMQ